MNLHGMAWPMIATFLGSAMCVSSLSAQEPLNTALLAPGVLISTSEQAPVAFVADAQGRVAAIGLNDGVVSWRGPAEGLPLALVGRQLVVLGRPGGPGQLSLQLLDPEDGSALGGVVGELPEGVLASPDAQPNRVFEATADTSTGALRIRWSYAEWPLQGAQILRKPGAGTGRREASGVVSVDFAANRVQEVSEQGMPAPRIPDLIGSQRLASVEGTQILAADDAFVQVSTAVADESLGVQWRWSLHERSSGRSAGTILLPYASAPFLLRGNQLLWRSEPLTQRQPSGTYLTHPARLVAQDLTQGRELWSVDLLDRKYRGVLPP